MKKKDERLMKIGEMAERAGVGHGTIYFYEKNKLLMPSQRSGRGNRYYDMIALDRLKMIIFLKDIGMNLIEIRKLVEVIFGSEKKNRDIESMTRSLHNYRIHIQEKILSLQKLNRRLSKEIKKLKEKELAS